MIKRVFLIIMDSVGCGNAPDAKEFDDEGANTIKHISERENGIYLPNLETLGYGNVTEIKGVNPVKPLGIVTTLQELSRGKDTMTGHWEMMGIETLKPFKTFTETGFPKELLDELSRRCKRGIIGNISASGTEIIEKYGEHQEKTGDLIVYTSADSVLQIAANEKVIPLEELYEICHIARELTLDERYKVGRVIARPYIKTENGYLRTPNRHDYALSPTNETTLDYLKEAGFDVISVGKINDIFNTKGITEHYSIKSNHDGMERTLDLVKNRDFNGLCFINLVDFDAMYGHRRDVKGYKMCLEEFDRDLRPVLDNLREDDIIMISADHGNDPTYKGTDHTREMVPLMIYGNKVNSKILNSRKSYADIGKTIGRLFNVKDIAIGEEIEDLLKR